MWVSRKQWNELEKRVARLEESTREATKKDSIPLSVMKAALKEALYQAPKQDQIDIKIP